MNAVSQEESTDAAVQRLFAKELAEGFSIAGCHRYNDADGFELFRVVRLKHPARGKIIRPMHRDGARYRIGRPERPANGWPLYRPPYPLVETDPVFIVEGEACADALAKLGLTTRTSGNSESAGGADWSLQKDRCARLWPDNDDAGAKYAGAVNARLGELGCAVDVLDVASLNLSQKGDCVDWLAKHPNATAEDVRALALVVQAAGNALVAESEIASVELRRASEIAPQPIRWLWSGYLARGKLHILAGAPGTGKTTIALALAAAVSRGGRWPDGSSAPAGNVLIWSGEDDAADTLVPRLKVAGANLARVFIVGETRDGSDMRSFDPATDLALLELEAERIGDVALLVADPVVNAVAGDSHKNTEVRRALQPLVNLGQRLDCAVLGITHFTKGSAGRDPTERVTGSLAFCALPRVVLVTAKGEADEVGSATRLLARAKSNIGPDGGGFAYALEQHGTDGLDASLVVWGAPLTGSARELLGSTEVEADDAAGQDAASFLRDLLKHGSMASKDVYREAEGAGYSRDQMKRAKVRLAVDAVKLGMSEGWAWRLPCPEGRGNSSEGSEEREQLNPLPSLPSVHPALGEIASSGPVETFDL